MADSLAQEKQGLRKVMAAARAGVINAAVATAQANAHLIQFLTQHYGASLPHVTLSGYMAMRGELDPSATMTAHAGPVCVPVVRSAGQALEFHRWTPDGVMVPGAFKALVPAQSDPLVPDALIVPMLAFDRSGYRLGYGGGFYDRTLAQLRAQGRVLAIGFAFAEQLSDRVPYDHRDQRLDAVVTQNGVLWPE
ncbi:MAG: 5-formyltetrahydrofolate cyclo-ligase [Rhodobacteraceae bacterium]|nr:MAG: 5-formyltetrahydrofolate cyclo-ligase [Paracoccaceae bacterium]